MEIVLKSNYNDNEMTIDRPDKDKDTFIVIKGGTYIYLNEESIKELITFLQQSLELISK